MQLKLEFYILIAAGGEKVLWCIIYSLLNSRKINKEGNNKLEIAIFTGDLEFPDKILQKAQERFNINLMQFQNEIKFKYIPGRKQLEPKPFLTMLQQIIGTFLYTFKCISKYQPDDKVEFIVSPTFQNLQQIFQKCQIGIHTMEYEHFGIAIVEMMAGGLITIAHNSAGPKEDIIQNNDKQQGFLCDKEEDYIEALEKSIQIFADNELLSDLTIEKIDFEWVQKTTKMSHLKKGVKLIEQDGDYFPELKKAILDKIKQIDPKQDPRRFNAKIDPVEHDQINKEQSQWVEEQRIKEQKLQQLSNQAKNSDIFAENKNLNPDEIKQQLLQQEINIKKAENEKNKGNEAIRSKDYNEALQYYTKSIEYNPSLAASYCNRALNYEKCIKDCNKAIAMKNDYLKAYHRRGKANIELKNYTDAYQDFKFIMEKEPDNSEVNSDLQEVTNLLKKSGQQIDQGFKRVQIVEEDDEDEDEEEEENEQQNDKEQTQQKTIEKSQNQIQDSLVSLKEFENISKKCDEKKEKATALMKDGLFEQAISLLMQCVEKVEETGPHKEQQGEFDYQTKRSMALEKVDKIRSAKNDFTSVKDLDPGNLQASQGLSRTQPYVDEEKEENTIQYKENKEMAEEEKVLEEIRKQSQFQDAKENQQEKQQQNNLSGHQIHVTLEQLEILKEKANKTFKDKQIHQALDLFTEGTLTFQQQYKRQIKQDTKVQGLYLQFMTNKALCELNLKQFEDVLKTTDKVLSIEPNNQKAIYRNALASKSLAINFNQQAEQETNDLSKKGNLLKQALEYSEQSRKELERLQKLQTKNDKVSNELQESVKLSVQLKLQMREQEQQQNPNQKAQPGQQNTSSQQFQPESPIKAQEYVKTDEKKIDNQYLDNVAKSAMDQVLEKMINEEELPKNPTTFEKNLDAFKKQPERLYHYLQRFKQKNFEEIYKKKDLPPDYLIFIAKNLKQKEDKQKVLEIFQGLAKTNKFSLCVMCLSKKEKQEIKEVLESVNADQELLKQYKL
ncbi:hypothetical protein PPERSA_04260 [Pseudocohnilembus persalinus]|uniref:GDP-Man:Man(3)GlcNAc(2)-PP-dolichol alpha-1,2-mannosyltransferase n=1 Tax=Pseudocohnilembus persalinus TaxID=266149 RepID=A0A0V0QNU1_PSEPJ|nr:hypothetical protein PPERSA_04260 [Pseudocohnilembus persalinus]|eukprot:KRX03752.1 hypothetical protein PPERSA_04260 [Pseudocohnilembus persalinus]